MRGEIPHQEVPTSPGEGRSLREKGAGLLNTCTPTPPQPSFLNPHHILFHIIFQISISGFINQS